MPKKRCPNGTRKNPLTKECESKSKKLAYKKVSRKSIKPSAKQRARAKVMRNELVELSKAYQAHKNEQVVKKNLARKIKANNLARAKNSLKKAKGKGNNKANNNAKVNNKAKTQKRKRCPNGTRKNKNGDCVPKK